MGTHRVDLHFALLVLILLLNTASSITGIEGPDFGCKALDQADHVLYSKDYGPSGIAGPVNLTLTPGLQPGAVISVVTKTTTRGQTNLFNEINEYIIHVDARIGWGGRNELLLTTYMNGAWRHDYKELINPIASGAKVTTTIIYEAAGYRIFINGREIAFYEHRKFKKPTLLNLEHDVVYKVIYLTTARI